MTALVAGALLLSTTPGCTTEGGGGGTGGGTLQSVAGVGRAQLESGGSATWGVDQLPVTLNAFQFEADRTTDQIAGAVLPMLFTVDAHGRPRLNGDYLRSAEITEREPKQTVVYTLNPEAKWSDGKKIGAADFTAQWKALNGEDNAYWSARNSGYNAVESVAKGPDAGQVTVTFARPYADWKSLFSPLYPRSVTDDPDRFNDGARTELPVSGGPFELKKVDGDKKSVTLVRNDAWWGDPALLDELVFTAVPRGQRRAALIDGRLDIAEIGPADADRITSAHDGVNGDRPREEKKESDDAKGDAPGGNRLTGDALHDLATAHVAGSEERAAAERYARAYAETERARERAFATREEAVRAKLQGFTVHRAYDAGYTQLALNGSSPALDDERVRWAIARALDRKKLAGLVHEPAGLPVKPLGSHLRVIGQAGYQDNSDALGKTGTGAATAALDDAGWRLSDVKAAGERPAAPVPVRAKDGEPLELRFVLPEGRAGEPLREVARAIADMLREVGITAEIAEVEQQTYFDDHIVAGNFDLALFSWPATAFPASDAAPLYAKPRAVPGGDLLIEQNYTRVGTDYIDQLLNQAAAELDEEEHDKLLNRADSRLWAAAGSIPLYQRPQLVATNDSLAGVGAFGMETPRYQDIGHRS
ncbi:ABC transporter family substrate-binding protein [Streptomyces radicis]|uniref:ABC transporter family substrate-binding protein n=1 Tax=Streptomyces radicis TaxID=1750517 RepID=UPI001E369D8C|nr:ABC transporter family substrate-binding protein [Streptomyces radicis]